MTWPCVCLLRGQGPNGGRRFRTERAARSMPTDGRRCGWDNTSETRRVPVHRQDSCRSRGKNHPVRRNLPSSSARLANGPRGSDRGFCLTHSPARPRRMSGWTALARALPRSAWQGGNHRAKGKAHAGREQQGATAVRAHQGVGPEVRAVWPARQGGGGEDSHEAAQAEGTFEGPLRACLSSPGSKRRRGRRRRDLALPLPLSGSRALFEGSGLLPDAPGGLGELLAPCAPFLRGCLRPTSLLQALLESVHQIDHLPARRPRRSDGDLLALGLLLDEGKDTLAVFVIVFFRIELLARQLRDEPKSELDLAVLGLHGLFPVDLPEIPDLVVEVHGVKNQATLEGADEDQAFLPAENETGDGDLLRSLESPRQELVGLAPALVRPQEVGLVHIDGVHGGEGHELRDVDVPRGLALQGLQLVVGDANVLLLAELVSLHEIIPVDHLITDRTVRLVLDPAAALGMEQMEGHLLRDHGGIEPDGNRHQPERDRA